ATEPVEREGLSVGQPGHDAHGPAALSVPGGCAPATFSAGAGGRHDEVLDVTEGTMLHECRYRQLAPVRRRRDVPDRCGVGGGRGLGACRGGPLTRPPDLLDDGCG